MSRYEPSPSALLLSALPWAAGFGAGLLAAHMWAKNKRKKASGDHSASYNGNPLFEASAHGPAPPVEAKGKDGQRFSTLAARFYPVHPMAVRGLSTPIVTASTFRLDSVEHGARLSMRPDSYKTDDDGYVYARWANPTNHLAAECIANLEGAKGTLLFSSGMGAISATLLTLLKSGDHIIAPSAVYGGCFEFLSIYCSKFGVEVTQVDATNIENFRSALRPNTRVVYAESPCNPTMRLTDLYALGDLAIQRGVFLVVDATFATPYHVQVLSIPGVSVSLHAATKYLGGHSDLTAGCVSSNDEALLSRLAKTQKIIGSTFAAFDSAMLMRGLKTLDVRMERHSYNALNIARFLAQHPLIERVHYPGLETHPDHLLAKKMMRHGFGGMISFEVKGGLEAGKAVVQNLKLINLAVSLGSIESLMCHPATMTHVMLPEAARRAAGIPDGMIRFSVGIEHVQDLISDLSQAIEFARPFAG